MAPSTIGHARTDKIRILGMADAAYDLARNLLAPDGAFVCKLFQGGAPAPLLNVLKRDFARVRHAKPPARRKDSSEIYQIGSAHVCTTVNNAHLVCRLPLEKTKNDTT